MVEIDIVWMYAKYAEKEETKRNETKRKWNVIRMGLWIREVLGLFKWVYSISLESNKNGSTITIIIITAHMNVGDIRKSRVLMKNYQPRMEEERKHTHLWI